MPFVVQKLCGFMLCSLSDVGLSAYAPGVLFRKFFPVPIKCSVFPFLLYQIQGISSYVEVLDSSVLEFCVE